MADGYESLLVAENLQTEAMNVVNIDEEIMGGAVVFAGTRVPIQTLYDHLQEDEALAEFLDGFPSVSREQVLDLFRLSQQVLHLAFKLNSMKTLGETREIIRRVLTTRIGTNGVGEVKNELVESADQNRFLVICSGWRQDKNEYMLVYDVQVREDGLVIIHADRTDNDLADYLIDGGIPQLLVVKGYAPDTLGLLAQPKLYGS